MGDAVLPAPYGVEGEDVLGIVEPQGFERFELALHGTLVSQDVADLDVAAVGAARGDEIDFQGIAAGF